MKKLMIAWAKDYLNKNYKISYLDQTLYHLFHGELKNRNYKNRHKLLSNYNFDPLKDIKDNSGAWEWSSDKKLLHQEIESYFKTRNK